MSIQTEPIGSLPRPAELLAGLGAFEAGSLSREELDELYDDAVRDTVTRLEDTGSPVVSDGEQRKPSFVTYPNERERIGVHTCPGGDHDSTHSADVDYADFLPGLFRINAGRFYVPLASEADPPRVLRTIADHAGDSRQIFVGVIDPINPRVESPEEVRDRVLEAARVIPVDRLGTTDDCGFSPFGDDTSTARETAFGKIRARIEGTSLAESNIGA